MKTLRTARAGLLVVVGIFCLTGTGWANIPEPDVIYYGKATHRGDDNQVATEEITLVLDTAAQTRLADTIPHYCADMDPEKTAKLVAQFANADLAVAVIASPKPSEKIPEIEQTLSAGAVAMNLLSAALAAGWGANWLSGWISHHRPWREEHLNLAANEWIAGFIHIGTERMAPPERPRPDLSNIVTWVET